MGLGSFLSSLMFRRVHWHSWGGSGWFRVRMRVRGSVIVNLHNACFSVASVAWLDGSILRKPHLDNLEKSICKHVCIHVCRYAKSPNLFRDSRCHSGIHRFSNTFLAVVYFFCFLPLSFLSLCLVSCLSWRVWWSRKTSNRPAGTQAAVHFCVHPFYYSQEWTEEGGAWPLSVPGVLYCGCSFIRPLPVWRLLFSLRRSFSSSAYPSVEPRW